MYALMQVLYREMYFFFLVISMNSKSSLDLFFWGEDWKKWRRNHHPGEKREKGGNRTIRLSAPGFGCMLEAMLTMCVHLHKIVLLAMGCVCMSASAMELKKYWGAKNMEITV